MTSVRSLSVSRHRRPQIHGGQHGNGSSRIPQKYVGRIILQESPLPNSGWSGPVKGKSIKGEDKIFLEGPHIFKRNGWYYLFFRGYRFRELHGRDPFCVPGVSGDRMKMYQSLPSWREPATTRHFPSSPHAITRTIPFKSRPCRSRGNAERRSGTRSISAAVPSPTRERSGPQAFPGRRRYPLGRETAVQKMRWTVDDWLVLDNGTTLPDTKVPAPELPPCPCPEIPARDDFDLPSLAPWQSLRVPMNHTHISLTAPDGFACMEGRDWPHALRRRSSPEDGRNSPLRHRPGWNFIPRCLSRWPGSSVCTIRIITSICI